MKIRQLIVATTLVMTIPFLLFSLSLTGLPLPPAQAAQTRPPGSQPPLLFIENVGQFEASSQFQIRNGQTTIFLTQEAIWFSVHNQSGGADGHSLRFDQPKTANSEAPDEGVNLKVSFPGANPAVQLEPFDRLNTQVSTFMGNDPSRWHTNIPVWGGVRYKEIYPGLDLEIRGENGRWAWKLVSSQGVNAAIADKLAAVRLRVEGAEALTTEATALQLTTKVGIFGLPLLQVAGRDSLPLTLQSALVNGEEVIAPFAQRETTPETSDPPASGQVADDLIYSTFLGGANRDDFGIGIEVNSLGEAYITGSSGAADLPTTPGAFEEVYQGDLDAFVIKLNADGSDVLFATYLGGSQHDDGFEIELDANQNIYVAGRTNSPDFPTSSGAFQMTPQGNFDAFMVKLNAAGNALQYGTYLGGDDFDDAFDFDLDVDGNAYIVGTTYSFNFPTLLSQRTFSGEADAYVTKLNSDGTSLVFSSLLGGSEIDTGYGVALDSSKNVYVAGQTSSSNFPVTANAYDLDYNQNGDAFIAKISSTGTVLNYATFVGGSGYDDAIGLEVDDLGNAFVMGEASPDFPVTLGAFDTKHSGLGDAFGLVLSTVTTGEEGLVYSSFIGGSGEDWGYDIKLDLEGPRFFVMGYTQSEDFPVTVDALDKTQAKGAGCGPSDNPYRCGDAFIIEFTSDGTGLVNSTYLGGSGEDWAVDMAIDSNDGLYITGLTASSNFPTTPGAYDTVADGGTCDTAPNTRVCFDAFVAKVAITPIMTSVTLSPGSSATLVSNDPAGSTTLQFPAGSVTATTIVTYAYQLSIPPAPLVQIDQTFSLTATQDGLPLTTFDKPFTISVTYSNDQIGAIREETLNFYRLSPNVWRTTDITPVAQSANQINGTAVKTGIFAVFGEAKLTYFPIIFREF